MLQMLHYAKRASDTSVCAHLKTKPGKDKGKIDVKVIVKLVG